MISSVPALAQELATRGLLVHDPLAAPPAAPDDELDRPWYIGLLLGVSGWLAGLFVLAFVALLLISRSDPRPIAGFLGVLLLAAAWGLFRIDRAGAFAAQLALALSIAGQCLVLFALNAHEGEISLATIAFSALGLQLVLALVMPNRMHRTLSAFFAVMAWALGVQFALFGEPWFRPRDEVRALAWGPALAAWWGVWLPVGALGWWAIRSEADWMARGRQAMLRPLLVGLVVGLAVATLASEPLEQAFWFGRRGASDGWLALWPLLSALAALGGAAAGFALGSRALVGLCVVGMLGHLAHFYYALGASLLLKSCLLLAMGLAFLGAARLLRMEESR